MSTSITIGWPEDDSVRPQDGLRMKHFPASSENDTEQTILFWYDDKTDTWTEIVTFHGPASRLYGELYRLSGELAWAG